MSVPLRDDAVYRTRQAWIRTGLGALAVGALAIRAAVLAGADVPALVMASLGFLILAGVGVRRARQAVGGSDISRWEAVLALVAVLLLGCSGVVLAVNVG